MSHSLRTFVMATLALCWSGAQALACGGPPPYDPPVFWFINHGDTNMDGKLELWVGVETTIFDSSSNTAPATCQCGLGLSGPSLPTGLDVLGAKFAIVDKPLPGQPHTDMGVVVQELALNRDSSLDPILASGSSAGGLWFGFSGVIPPFAPTPLGPNQVYKLWFEVEIDFGQTMKGVHGEVASGAANDLVHPVSFWRPLDTRIVPEPTTAGLLALGGLGAIARRRRNA